MRVNNFLLLPNSGNFEIMLDGWIKFTKEEDRKKFADEISDHCLLFCVNNSDWLNLWFTNMAFGKTFLKGKR